MPETTSQNYVAGRPRSQPALIWRGSSSALFGNGMQLLGLTGRTAQKTVCWQVLQNTSAKMKPRCLLPFNTPGATVQSKDMFTA